MLRINIILHPTDFSRCARAALPYALDLARRHGSELRLLHVAPVFGDDPVRGVFEASVEKESFYGRLRDEIDTRMEEMLVDVDVSGVRVRRVQAFGPSAGAVITEYVRAEDVDLVVLGTYGRRGLRKLLLGSVAQEVIRHAFCPVLAVCEGEITAPPKAPRRVLVSVDFSGHSLGALAYAKELAALYGASLDVLHVIDPVMRERLQKAGLKNRERTERAEAQAAQERLVWLSKEVQGPVVDTTCHVALGYPSSVIVESASAWGADLVVLASHGMGGIDRIPLGSVVERVTRACPCPLFITRPFGKSLLPMLTGTSHVAAEPQEAQPV